MERREFARATIGVSISVFLISILEFMTSIVLAKYFGTTIYMDAYLFAISFPNLIFSLLSVSLGTVLIPLIIEYRLKKGDDETNRFISVIINLVAAALLVLALFCSMMAAYICSFAGFRGEALKIATNLLIILSPLIPILGLISIERNILNVYKRFSLPAFSPLISSILIIGTVLILTERLGIYSLAGGVLIGSFLQMFFLGWIVLGIINYTPIIDISLPEVKKVWRMTIPLMFSAAGAQINLLVDRLVGIRSIGGGDISALNYGSVIREIPLSIFTFSLVTVMFPTLTMHAVSGRATQLNSMIITALRLTVFFLLPMTMLFLLLGEPVVTLLFERGVFTPASTQKTVEALRFYLLGLLPCAWCIILARYFYAIQDIAIPIKLGLMAVLLNIILDIALVKPLGIGGIAFATSLVEIILLVVYCYLWIRRNRAENAIPLSLNAVGIAFLKIFFATFIMGAICYLILNNMGLLTNYYSNTLFKILHVIIPLTVASISYLIVCYLIKVEEFQILREGIFAAFLVRKN